MYCISFIVLLAGFGYCAGNVPKCDARVAAGVSKLTQGPLRNGQNTLIWQFQAKGAPGVVLSAVTCNLWSAPSNCPEVLD
jgi:hypothetical protein